MLTDAATVLLDREEVLPAPVLRVGSSLPYSRRVHLSTPAGPLPTLQVAAPARSTVELPDLKDSWAWAHAQVAADDSTPANVTAALNGGSELSLSRRVCPRILAPDTEYIACVVPTTVDGSAGLRFDDLEAG
jgi:hypothetical protein